MYLYVTISSVLQDGPFLNFSLNLFSRQVMKKSLGLRILS